MVNLHYVPCEAFVLRSSYLVIKGDLLSLPHCSDPYFTAAAKAAALHGSSFTALNNNFICLIECG